MQSRLPSSNLASHDFTVPPEPLRTSILLLAAGVTHISGWQRPEVCWLVTKNIQLHMLTEKKTRILMLSIIIWSKIEEWRQTTSEAEFQRHLARREAKCKNEWMQLCWITASGSNLGFRGPPRGRCPWHAPLPEVAPSSGEGAPAAGNSHEFIPTCSAPTFLTFFLQSGIRDHSRFPVSTAAVGHSWVCLLNGPWLLRAGRNTESSVLQCERATTLG